MANRLVDFGQAAPVLVNPELGYRLGQTAAMERIRRGKATAGDYLWALPNEFVERTGNALVNSAISGLTLPGDALTGKVRVPLVPSSDPVASDEIIRRSLDLTGAMASGTLAAPRGVIGSGMVRPLKSTLAEAVDRIPMKSAPAEQWAATLKNTPGVKSEEMDWTGLNDMLKEHKAPLSKAELSDYLDKNKVQLEEYWKGSELTGRENLEDAMQFLEQNGHDVPTNNAREIVQAATDAGWQPGYQVPEEGGTTKFHQYQLPGGTNYRELVLTLPKQESAVTKRMNEAVQKLGRELTPAERSEFERLTWQEDDRGQYRSSHWDEPNPLLHVRMNDRTLADANGLQRKTLFLEEVQSDWHQAGRKQGYKTPHSQKMFDDAVEKFTAWQAEHPNTDSRVWREENPELSRAVREAGAVIGVPDAPFKKTWPDLALKRMLNEAVEHGYDQIAWTDGATQAERYDLSKQISRVRFTHNRNVEGTLEAMDHHGNTVITQHISDPKQLPDYIGKEVAEKLMDEKNHNGNGVRELSGVDLKVGGEGMKGFYDNILPKTANKLFGKMGGKVEQQKLAAGIDQPALREMRDNLVDAGLPVRKVEKMTVEELVAAAHDFGLPGYDEAGVKTVHVLPITPQMKAAVHSGLPLFSAGVPLPPSTGGDKMRTDEGTVTGRHIKYTPVDTDPFQ